MPNYDYTCPNCGFSREINCLIVERHREKRCTKCRGIMRKDVSKVGIAGAAKPAQKSTPAKSPSSTRVRQKGRVAAFGVGGDVKMVDCVATGCDVGVSVLEGLKLTTENCKFDVPLPYEIRRRPTGPPSAR